MVKNLNLKVIQNIRKILNARSIVKEFFFIKKFERRNVNSDELIVDSNSETNILVSLTTYSKRIDDVFLVIESIGQQTRKAKKVVLWLDVDEFSINSIPASIINQVSRGLEVKFCKNLRSYKKIVPTVEDYKDYNIITIDDDILYPVDFISCLVDEAKRFPNTIISNLAHKIKFNNGILEPYNDWDLYTSDTDESMSIFPVGVGGIYYPNGCFHSDIGDDSLFMNLSPSADDVWLKVMSSLNGIKSKRVSDARAFEKRFIPIRRSQDIALHHQNVGGGNNDIQLRDVLHHYQKDCKLFMDKNI